MVRYTDLVNETLEAFIAASANLTISSPTNNDVGTPVSGEAGQNLQPTRTDWTIYEKVIQHERSPPSYFPFNVGLHACREYLKALGLSLYELFGLFSPLAPPTNALKQMNPEEQSRFSALLETAQERQLAAEYLSLSLEEFVMMTREAFQSPALLVQFQDHSDIFTTDEYAKRIGLRLTGEHWGYSTDTKGNANDKMVGKINGIRGIGHINAEFLPRSGVEFQELLEILKTEFLSERLVISVETDKGTFTGRLGDMKRF